MTFHIRVTGFIHEEREAAYKVKCKTLEEAEKRAASRFRRDYKCYWDSIRAYPEEKKDDK